VEDTALSIRQSQLRVILTNKVVTLLYKALYGCCGDVLQFHCIGAQKQFFILAGCPDTPSPRTLTIFKQFHKCSLSLVYMKFKCTGSSRLPHTEPYLPNYENGFHVQTAQRLRTSMQSLYWTYNCTPSFTAEPYFHPFTYCRP